jgi:hypothetical protein
MLDVPTTEPSSVTAGDTLTWSRSLADYPASTGWVLAYALVCAGQLITITASASGDEHIVSVAAATSAAYVPGTYAWQATVTKTTERYTVGTGTLTILPNLAAQGGGYDARTHAAKTLAALEAWIESHDMAVADYQIAGRAMRYISIPDLLKLRDAYKAEVARETAVVAGTGTRLVVRF